jgi:hypothetical protein
LYISILIDISVRVDLINQALYHIRVLRVQVESLREVLQSLIHIAQLLIYFADDYVDGGFLGHLHHQLKQDLQGFLEPLKRHQHCCLLVFIQRVLRIQLLSYLEAVQCLNCLVAVVSGHAEVSVEHRRPIIDVDSRCEELRSLVKLLLLQAYVSQTPPSIVVAFICSQCSLIALLG